MENPTDKEGLLHKHQIKLAVPDLRITMPVLSTYNLTIIMFGRRGLVTYWGEVALGVILKQHEQHPRLCPGWATPYRLELTTAQTLN